MSDSESSQNSEELSDLDEKVNHRDGYKARKNGEDQKEQLKGILNDVEETEVSWKDLVCL